MTTTKRVPIFAMPALDPESPDFMPTLNGLAGAGVALKQFMDSINGGKYPGAEAIDKAVDAIVFFAVEGDKAYAREYLAHCSMNEFVQVLRIIETCVNDYAATVRAMQMHAASGRGVINGD